MLFDAGYRGEIAVIKPYVPSYFSPQKKKLKIAFSPRKLPIQSRALLTVFHSMFTNYLDIEWVAIENMDRKNVARLLSESAIYASFASIESLGLSALEAMKCGCIVVGDHGGGGSEFANKENGFWVRADELISYSRKIAEAIELFKKFGEKNTISVAAIKSANAFSFENFHRSLENFWLDKASKSNLYKQKPL
jgi:glycosyltransferase involved in cell wall biosynthesis